MKIRLIVRGICSIIPGVEGLSENIEAISIVDKYLEHSRVYVFCNGGEEQYFISSADFMKRNLDYRVEVTCPIFDKNIQQELRDWLEIQWSDNAKARLHNGKQNNPYKTGDNEKSTRSQDAFYKYLKDKNKK